MGTFILHLAVAGLLTEQGWSVDWVGTERGIEQRLVPAAGLPLHHLSVSGLRGKNWVARVQGALRLAAALWQSLALMWRVKPDVVLGMGGYAAGPAGTGCVVDATPTGDPRAEFGGRYNQSLVGAAGATGALWFAGRICRGP